MPELPGEHDDDDDFVPAEYCRLPAEPLMRADLQNALRHKRRDNAIARGLPSEDTEHAGSTTWR